MSKAIKRRRESLPTVHIFTMIDPYDNFVYVVPTTSSRSKVSKAIDERLHASCVWSEDLSAWLVDDNAYDLLCTAIEEEIGEEVWCAECADWLENEGEPELCEHVATLKEVLDEIGCEVVHESELDDDDEEDDVEEGPGFKIPEALRKLFAEELNKAGSVIGDHLKARSKDIIGKQAKAFGVTLSDDVLDQLFEAVFSNMRGKAADRATGMTAAEAAVILGVTMPCSKDDIVAAFRKKARETHPDMAGGSQDAFLKVSAAREVLMGEAA